ncbi:FHA domain-containing protein [Roseimaritima multifibrata]|nr:FHA domain-containing protein [Roseimaritima multifibrata]
MDQEHEGTATLAKSESLEFRVSRPGTPNRRMRLSGTRYTFGNGAGCAIRLEDPTLRELHAVLLRSQGRSIIRAYSVPVELNGRLTSEAELQTGDVVRMGVYHFELLGDVGGSRGDAVPADEQPSAVANRNASDTPVEHKSSTRLSFADGIRFAGRETSAFSGRTEDGDAEQERAEQERAEQERAEQERAEQERAEQERAEQERAEQERAEQERAEQERAEQERAEQERAEQRQADSRKAEQERNEQERAAQQAANRKAEEERAELKRTLQANEAASRAQVAAAKELWEGERVQMELRHEKQLAEVMRRFEDAQQQGVQTSSAITAMQQQLMDVTEHLQTVTATSQARAQERDSFASQVDVLKVEREEIQEEKEKALSAAEVANRDLATARQHNAELLREHAEAIASVESLTRRCDAVTEQLEKSNQACRDFASQRDRLTAELKQVVEERDQAQTTVSEQADQLNSQAALIDQLRTQIDDLQQSVEQAGREAEELREQCQKAFQSVERLEGLVQQSDSARQTDRESWEQEAAELRDNVQRVSQDLAVAVANLTDSNATAEALNQDLQETKRALLEAEQNLEQAEQTLETRPTPDEIETIRQRLETTEQQLLQLREEYDRVDQVIDRENAEKDASIEKMALEAAREESPAADSGSGFHHDEQGLDFDSLNSGWPTYDKVQTPETQERQEPADSDSSAIAELGSGFSAAALEADSTVEDESFGDVLGPDASQAVVGSDDEGDVADSFGDAHLGQSHLGDDESSAWEAINQEEAEPVVGQIYDADPIDSASLEGSDDSVEWSDETDDQNDLSNASPFAVSDSREEEVRAEDLGPSEDLVQAEDEAASELAENPWASFSEPSEETTSEEITDDQVVEGELGTDAQEIDQQDGFASFAGSESPFGHTEQSDQSDDPGELGIGNGPWGHAAADPIQDEANSSADESDSDEDQDFASIMANIEGMDPWDSATEDDSNSVSDSGVEAGGLASQLLREIESGDADESPEAELDAGQSGWESYSAFDDTNATHLADEDSMNSIVGRGSGISDLGDGDEVSSEPADAYSSEDYASNDHASADSGLSSLDSLDEGRSLESDSSGMDEDDSYEAYKKRLESESAEEASDKPATVAPAVQPTPASSGAPESAEMVDDDSIEAYMNRLLQRVQGRGDSNEGGAPAVVAAPVAAVKSVAAEEMEALTAELAKDDTPLDPDSPYIPRSQAPERTSNLAAMRELANVSARDAIQRSVRQQIHSNVIRKFAMAAGGFVGGMIFLVVSRFGLNWQLMASGCLFLLAGFWIWEAIRVHSGLQLELRNARQTAELENLKARSDKREGDDLQQALTAIEDDEPSSPASVS